MLVRPRRIVGWSTLLVGVLVALLGAWGFFVPLVGPYFDFGFATDDAWSFSEMQWTLSLAPGIAAFIAGLGMIGATRMRAWLPGLLALSAGAWLVIGPSVHPLWSSGLDPIATSEWKTAVLWIGHFYGTGALLVYLAGLAHGSLPGGRVPDEDEETLIGGAHVEIPEIERTTVRERTMVT